MNLTPTESERLTVFTAAEFARRNLREGIPLSHPEAVAYLTDEAMLMARTDLPFSEVRERAGQLLTSAQVEPGVPSMISYIMLELPTLAGSKLLTIYSPIAETADGPVPGEVIALTEAETVFDPSGLIDLEVVNTGDRDIQVRSMTHFFEVNKALAFDRAAAYGHKLAINAGGGTRFEPGIPKVVTLTPFVGERVVHGQAGLVNGPLDDPDTRARAFERARQRGYIQEES
ncbi:MULTISPECIES: urease subunit beta [unclassified Dietzia]|uniref:urease subunit beta n=1 Tax=unclassified Dietzia TaxID=2617939 RepID=UPI0015CA8A6D|nr:MULTISPECIES: urease subunit beta [unclassified Dietzia]MBB1040207.1 Urease subunit alpha [Dietzia sp. Cai40]MBB1043332.1 Urease subunit alpha [Dietzia sp. DQ11-44]